MSLWTRGGILIRNAAGNLIECPDCPCVGTGTGTGTVQPPVSVECCVEPIAARLYGHLYSYRRVPTGLSYPNLSRSNEYRHQCVTLDHSPGYTPVAGSDGTEWWVGSVPCAGNDIKIELTCMTLEGYPTWVAFLSCNGSYLVDGITPTPTPLPFGTCSPFRYQMGDSGVSISLASGVICCGETTTGDPTQNTDLNYWLMVWDSDNCDYIDDANVCPSGNTPTEWRFSGTVNLASPVPFDVRMVLHAPTGGAYRYWRGTWAVICTATPAIFMYADFDDDTGDLTITFISYLGIAATITVTPTFDCDPFFASGTDGSVGICSESSISVSWSLAEIA